MKESERNEETRAITLVFSSDSTTLGNHSTNSMRATSSLAARSARRLYVSASVSRSWPAGLTGGSRSVVAAAAVRTTERRMPRPTTASLTTAAAASTSSPPPPTAAFSLYSHPRLYDAVFAFRDFDAEAQFLVDAWRVYGDKEQPLLSSFLDVGAGTGRHGAALARLLLSSSPSSEPSLSLFALDSSAEMLLAAAKAAREAGCPLRGAIEADMTKKGGFGEGVSESVQVALCALGTLAHALPPPSATAGDSGGGASDPALEVLRSAAAALVPGGILIVELPAAADLFDGTLLAGDAWDVPEGGDWRPEDGSGEAEGAEAQQPPQKEEKRRRIGQISKPQMKRASASSSPALVVEYGLPDDAFDPVSQVLQRTVVVSELGDDGEAGTEVGRETVAQRLFSPAEIRCLAREAGLRVAAELGDMELGGDGEESDPVSAQEGDRYVAVLVKKK